LNQESFISVKSKGTLFLVLFFGLLFMACSNSDDIEKTYTGMIISTRTSIFDDITNVRTDTLPITVVLDNSSFEVGSCDGALDRSLLTMDFTSDDCDCWCDCSPNVDCEGHPLLGTYAVQSDDASISLFSTSNQEYDDGTYYRYWQLDKSIILNK